MIAILFPPYKNNPDWNENKLFHMIQSFQLSAFECNHQGAFKILEETRSQSLEINYGLPWMAFNRYEPVVLDAQFYAKK